MSAIVKFIAGFGIGVVNVMLGAGGGMLTVPLYKKMEMTQREAQINAVSTILPITIISAIIYYLNGNINISDTYIYLIPGLLGSILGTFIIKKTSNKVLTVFFGILMIWAGLRLFFK